MIEERFWLLLSKKSFSEASDDELRELNELLLDHANLKDTEEAMSVLASQSPLPEENYEAEQAFERLIQKIKESDDDLKGAIVPGKSESKLGTKRISARARQWTLGLSFVSVVLVLLLVFRHNKVSSEQVTKDKVQLSKLITKPAQKAQLQLPDGSIVWLNASSNLTYDKDFGKDLREVNLTGEAFFDVAKDAAHPFIIHTKVVDVKVLGTEFNVKAYPNDAYTETSLIRGSVELTVKNRNNEKRYLKPNEKVMIANDLPPEEDGPKMTRPKPFEVRQSLTYDADSTLVETSWVQNRLIFQQHETFREVALKLERAYGVHITFSDDQVAQIQPFYSTLSTETITQILDDLKESLQFNYKMTGNDIVISK